MSDVSVGKRLERLRREVNYHDYRYHVLDDPLISDGEYDLLMVEIRRLEAEYPHLFTVDSPTQRVGGAAVEGFTPIQHRYPMLSLSNAFNMGEVESWHKRTANILGDDLFDMVCELKIDGLAVSLTYQSGRFIQGATRGDGYQGEGITHNLRTIKSIPLSLVKPDIDNIEVRGEVYMSIESFNRLNSRRQETGETLYSNPRNTAAGSLRQLDPKITASRDLDVYVYGIGYWDGIRAPDNQWDALKSLSDIGFRISPHNALCRTLGDVEKFYQRWLSDKDVLPYQVDGIVIKVNSFTLQNRLGQVGREPRWALAYKFPAQQFMTRLIDIGINVGRTGSLNPFAILEPVEIGGAIVKTATLHNQDDILRKDIRIGDWVKVERAGEVIPQVVGPITNMRTGSERVFRMPKFCPVCGSLVISESSEASHRCPNTGCAAQFLETLKHFVGKSAMDIEGLGDKWCKAIIESGLVSDVGDLYTISKEQLLGLDRMGDKLATKILANIHKSTLRPLPNVLFALGVLHVGLETSGLMTRHFGSLKRLSVATINELISIQGIGQKIADSVRSYFDSEGNRLIINKLDIAGVKLYSSDVIHPPKGDILQGRYFCLTGSLSSMSRADAQWKIEQLGGQIVDRVTRKTTHLIVGGAPGSKLGVAKSLGIPIISEDDFLALLLDEGLGPSN